MTHADSNPQNSSQCEQAAGEYRHERVAGRKFVKQGKGNEKSTSAGLRGGGNRSQGRESRGSRASNRIKGMNPRVSGKRGPNSTARREEGNKLASGLEPRGGGARKDPGGRCSAARDISVLTPRGRHILIRRSRSLLTL